MATQQFTIDVAFDPSAVGNESAPITFTTNDAANKTVTLTANSTAIAPVFPTAHLVTSGTALALNTTPIGGISDPATLTLSNRGGTPLNISAFNAVGLNRADFIVTVLDNNGNSINVSTNNGAFSIPVGRTYTVSVTFRPTINGNETAGITFSTNDAASVLVNLTETGTGTPPAAPLAPTGLTVTPISFHEIDLSFTDNSTNETNFRVYRSTTSATTGFTLVQTLARQRRNGNGPYLQGYRPQAQHHLFL